MDGSAKSERRPELTQREREVLSHVACGAGNRAISTALGIAEPTVKRHLTNAYRKLGVANRVQAALLVAGGLGVPPDGE